MKQHPMFGLLTCKDRERELALKRFERDLAKIASDDAKLKAFDDEQVEAAVEEKTATPQPAVLEPELMSRSLQRRQPLRRRVSKKRSRQCLSKSLPTGQLKRRVSFRRRHCRRRGLDPPEARRPLLALLSITVKRLYNCN